MREVMTRVLPVPAPARMRRGPEMQVTASCCSGLRSKMRSLVIIEKSGERGRETGG